MRVPNGRRLYRCPPLTPHPLALVLFLPLACFLSPALEPSPASTLESDLSPSSVKNVAKGNPKPRQLAGKLLRHERILPAY